MSKNAASKAPAAPQQPKIVHRMSVRYASGLIALAVIVVLYQMLRTCGQDIDLPFHMDTAGMIAAVQLVDSGSKAVAISPDGSIRQAPDSKAGITERDVVWRPDGDRVFFVSNREDQSFNLYRWNLGSDKVERRSLGRRSKSLPNFPPTTYVEDANDAALVISGGFVLEWIAKTGDTHQILPPILSNELGTKDEGAKDQMDALYQKLGTSFRMAKWSADKKFVVAVIRREDGNETLIVQEVGSAQPLPIAAGRSIEFDVSPKTNQVFFTVLDFRWLDPEKAPAQFHKGGRVTVPFRHGLFMIDLSNPNESMRPIAASQDDKTCFYRPAISPDGSMILMVSGVYHDGDVDPERLLLLPAEAGGAQASTAVVNGKVFEPSWGPDNDTIAYIQSESGRRAVHTVQRNGSNHKNVTGDKGDFAWPKISPQRKS